MDKKSIEGHRKRLREKFLKAGIDALHDYEIIELLLTLGTPRKDCKEQAKKLLRKFKKLSNVIEAPSEQLQEIKGIGPNNIFGIKFICEVVKKFLKKKIERKEYIKSSVDVFNYLFCSMRDIKREIFQVIYLDSKNKIIDTEKLFEGSITASVVYPRELIKSALKKDAVGVIFVHNHPSGDPTPSQDDKELTKRLVIALKSADIRVVDHIIIGGDKYFSFSDEKIMDSYNRLYESLF